MRQLRMVLALLVVKILNSLDTILMGFTWFDLLITHLRPYSVNLFNLIRQPLQLFNLQSRDLHNNYWTKFWNNKIHSHFQNGITVEQQNTELSPKNFKPNKNIFHRLFWNPTLQRQNPSSFLSQQVKPTNFS